MGTPLETHTPWSCSSWYVWEWWRTYWCCKRVACRRSSRWSTSMPCRSSRCDYDDRWLVVLGLGTCCSCRGSRVASRDIPAVEAGDDRRSTASPRRLAVPWTWPSSPATGRRCRRRRLAQNASERDAGTWPQITSVGCAEMQSLPANLVVQVQQTVRCLSVRLCPD